MAKKKVRYETQVINTDTVILHKGFSSIEFRNIGAVNARLISGISLPANNRFSEYCFINRPNEIIYMDIPVSFEPIEGIKAVECVKTYYEE